MIINKVMKYFSDSDYRFLINANMFHRYDSMPDEQYLKIKYKAALGKELNLNHPQRFNEKLQWLKLYNRKPEYTIMVDKYKVKEYVAKIIGEDYIIPTLGAWNEPSEINFEALPEQFVLKCNHNSGLGMYICRDKMNMNIETINERLQKGLKEDYYLKHREWPYKNVSRKIIAEKYMSDGDNGLIDYKVHNFNGEPKLILVCKDRFENSGLTEDFFTPEWEHLDIKRPKHEHSKQAIARPEELEEIIELSAKLSQNIPFLRTDFYIINHKVYFSELTFYPASGFEAYDPDEWDYKMGEWLELPKLI